MSLVKIELTEKSGFTMEFSVSKEAYEKAELVAYKKNVKSINVAGFRRGHAPKAIIERMYGKQIWFEDAINECLPEAYEEAIKEANIQVVGQPQFDLVSNDGDIVLKAVGFVKPQATIEGYKGIAVEKTVNEVTDAQIDEEIENARKRNARTIEITDRAAILGDTANIDFEGFADGVAFDGGKGESYDLVLGSGSFIPGFEDQIVGKSIGEEFDVNVTFPTEYGADNLAGKDATFKVKLNAIKCDELPALDDEFVKDVSEFDTLDEYKADIKAKMVKRNEEKAEVAVENAIAESLMELLKAEIPEVMFEMETENYLRDQDTRLRQNGLDLATYCKFTGMTLDDIRAQMRSQAERQVKVRLALETIATLENLQVTEEETDAEYTRIAENYNVPVDQVKAMILAEDLNADIKVGKALALVRENAKVSAPKAKKTTAKKTTAKKAETEGEEAPKAKKTTTKKTTAKKADKAE